MPVASAISVNLINVSLGRQSRQISHRHKTPVRNDKIPIPAQISFGFFNFPAKSFRLRAEYRFFGIDCGR
jgi:hypothetical protein